MKIRDVMHTKVVTVKADTPAKEAFEIMHKEGFRHLPVLDEQEHIVGILSDRDILSVAVSFEKRPRGQTQYMVMKTAKCRDVMTADPITISPDDNVARVVELMEAQKIGCLLVAEGGKLAGIVTDTDFLRLLVKLLGKA